MVRRGSLNPDAALHFKKSFPGQKIAETQQYKLLEDLARAANRWSQLKRNTNIETGLKLMRELGSCNNEIANALKTGLSRSTPRFTTALRMQPAENLRSHQANRVKDLRYE